jgi:type II secretion system protein N
MAQTESILVAPLPKPLLTVGIPVAFMWLTFAFIILGFPYDALVENFASRLENSYGVKLYVGEVDLQVGLLGPGFRLEDVSTRLPDGASYDLDHLYVRPAWSLSWLRGDPAVFLDVQTSIGGARGTAILGSMKGWDGDLREVDMSLVPYLNDPDAGLEMSGTLNATTDLVIGADGLVGEAEFTATDGVALHSSLPMGVPFKLLEGEIVFGGDTRLSVESLALESDFLNAKISGTVGDAPLWSQSELALELEISEIDPNLRPILSGVLPRVAEDGSASASIQGTIGSPQIR